MITSMYGHCDAFDVVYTQIGKDQWQATVPPDLTDGKYVVDIYGVDNTGFLVYWAGILYMYDSRFVKLELLPDSCVMFYTDTVDVSNIWDSSDRWDMSVIWDTFEVWDSSDMIEFCISDPTPCC